MEWHRYDYIIVGSGLTGATVAGLLARQGGKRVLVLEKASHIGGLAYDCLDESGLLVHPYGPHIFHTNNAQVVSFLSAYTAWQPYEHRVVFPHAGHWVSLPFSLRSLRGVFPPAEAQRLREKLLARYAYGATVSIRTLQAHADPDLANLGSFVYENVYLHYSKKQWGDDFESLDPFVLDRVPFRISEDDRYFLDSFQAMPKDGYTKMMARMLDHERITLLLDCDAAKYMRIEDDKLLLAGDTLRHGQRVICTCALDGIFGYCDGALPFRSIALSLEHKAQAWYQPVATVNYTHGEAYTRITEFKHITGQGSPWTTIGREYPQAYTGGEGQIQAYPLPTTRARALYDRYRARADAVQGLYCAGRLAEYRYLNMDESIGKAIRLGNELLYG